MKNVTGPKLCLVIGDPVEHSLSPLMHQAGFEALGLDNQYVFTAVRVSREDLPAAIAGVRTLGIKGVSCTIPHKEAVVEYVDELTAAAAGIGAVNTIINRGGRLIGDNTDATGIIAPLKGRMALSGCHAAVLGAGGAARAAVWALKSEGCQVTIYNRTETRAIELADEFGCNWRNWDRRVELADVNLVVQATSVGLAPNTHSSPLPVEALHAGLTIFDLVYTPYRTALLLDALSIGAPIIPGIEMFIAQGAAQFEHYTGYRAPIAAMRNVVLKYFGVNKQGE